MKPSAGSVSGFRRLLSIGCSAALAACATHPASPPSHEAHGYADTSGDLGFDARAIVARSDWNKMSDIKVEMVEYGYRPREIRLTAGQPYRITLTNYSSFNHYFTAPEFFRSVATRKAMVEGYAEIKAPYFTAVEVVKRGGTVDLYLVPVKKGRYTVHCELNDHRERGVEGAIIVE